ncbi:MAG: MgtC/SapB family protein [Acidimicrobiia bacterium]
MPSDIELAGRLAAALLLGGAIGLERELNGQVAGLRTHMTVALGAALFAIVSGYGFGEFVRPRNETNLQVDVTRVASNIVTGVGFLGGGAIIKNGSSVRGLTTAASLWVTAAVGLAVAMGAYTMAAVGTLGLLVALCALRRPRRWLRQRVAGAPECIGSREAVFIHLRPRADAEPVVAALRSHPGVEVSSVLLRESDDEIVVEADVTSGDLDAVLGDLAGHEDVIDLGRTY